jgi:hypothetical protein
LEERPSLNAITATVVPGRFLISNMEKKKQSWELFLPECPVSKNFADSNEPPWAGVGSIQFSDQLVD